MLPQKVKKKIPRVSNVLKFIGVFLQNKLLPPFINLFVGYDVKSLTGGEGMKQLESYD